MWLLIFEILDFSIAPPFATGGYYGGLQQTSGIRPAIAVASFVFTLLIAAVAVTRTMRTTACNSGFFSASDPQRNMRDRCVLRYDAGSEWSRMAADPALSVLGVGLPKVERSSSRSKYHQ